MCEKCKEKNSYHVPRSGVVGRIGVGRLRARHVQAAGAIQLEPAGLCFPQPNDQGSGDRVGRLHTDERVAGRRRALGQQAVCDGAPVEGW